MPVFVDPRTGKQSGQGDPVGGTDPRIGANPGGNPLGGGAPVGTGGGGNPPGQFSRPGRNATPGGADFQKLFQTLLGPEQSNPYGGTVSFEQAKAKDPGLTWETYKPKEDAWRDYAGKREGLMQYLQSQGYSLEDMGIQNKQEYGKHDYDMMGQGGQQTQTGGLDPGYQYDWNNGTKRYAISSDVNAINRPEQITPDEIARHQHAQEQIGKGFDTRAKQLYADREAKGGRTAQSDKIIQRGINVDMLAKRFGLDPNQVSGLDMFRNIGKKWQPGMGLYKNRPGGPGNPGQPPIPGMPTDPDS